MYITGSGFLLVGQVQLSSLNEMHQAMINYLIAKPDTTRRAMASHFGVSLPWLSTIIHSDQFQAELNRKKGQIFNVAIAKPIQERLVGAAHMAIDRLYDTIQAGGELRDISGAVEMLTKATGNFRQSAVGQIGAVQVNNFGMISPEDLAAARQKIGRVRQLEIENGETVAGDDQSEVRLLGGDNRGASSLTSQVFYQAFEAEGGLETRPAVREESTNSVGSEIPR